MVGQEGLNEAGEGSSNGFLSKLPQILWERKWLVVVPAALLSIAGIVVALVLPTTFSSRAVVLVESEIVFDQQRANADDGEIDRRIAKIRQQLMSRPDLVELIQTNNLYNASSRAEPLSKLVDRLRDATSIDAVDADISRASRGRNGQSSIAFALTVEYPQPALAQTIAQTFVDRLLKLSASQSLDETANAVRVLEDQQETVQGQLSRIESRINSLAGSNGMALASAQSAGTVSSGGAYETQIAALERENASLRNQLGSAVVERDPGVVAAEAQLAAIRAQYSDDHPDVKLAQTRLAAARSAASNVQARGFNGTIERQIAANNTAIAQLRSARGAELGRASQLAAAQARGPAIAAQVTQLQSQAESLSANLAKINGQLLNARSNAKLTEEQRGERLTLIEPPARPDRPTSPNRPLLAAAGVAAGLAAGFALAMLVELIIRPIRSAGAIARITGAPPLAVVPVLSKRNFRQRRRKAFWQRRRSDAATT